MPPPPKVCVDCGIESDRSDETELPEIAEVLRSSMMPTCQPLKVGDFEDIDFDAKFSPTQLVHKYRLKRVGANHYEISFRPFFRKSKIDLKKNNENETQVQKFWERRITECLRMLEGKTIGPNGERVDFKLHLSTDPRDTHPKISVRISEIERSHSRNWNQSISCSTIVHELFHWTGLVDEYPEDSKGLLKNEKTGVYEFVENRAEKTAYDCRKIYSENSIMANDVMAWQKMNAGWWMNTGLCECKKLELCEKHIAEKKKALDELKSLTRTDVNKFKISDKCPAGFEDLGLNMRVAISDADKLNFESGTGGIGGFGTFAKVGMGMQGSMGFGVNMGMVGNFKNINEPSTSITPIRPVESTYRFTKRIPSSAEMNILESRHFNAIVYPGCTDINREYYQDAQNAYRTSLEHGGLGCANLDWAK